MININEIYPDIRYAVHVEDKIESQIVNNYIENVLGGKNLHKNFNNENSVCFSLEKNNTLGSYDSYKYSANIISFKNFINIINDKSYIIDKCIKELESNLLQIN